MTIKTEPLVGSLRHFVGRETAFSTVRKYKVVSVYLTFSTKIHFPFFSKIICFEKSTIKVQTFRVANCTTIVTVKEKVINVRFILVVQFLKAITD